jgi:small nuclear ribonucleoprotein (snRNP)-like protein
MGMNNPTSYHSFLRRFFEGAYVQVKLQDGTTIERKLVKIDSSMEHNGLGNLILEDGIIIRVSYVQHIALKVKT